MRAYSIVGRGLGLIVFLVGIAMLAGVFWFGFKIFQDPGFVASASKSASAGAAGTAATNSAASILPRLVVLLVQLVFLLAMCVAASLIASKGIQLYAAGSLSHLHASPDRRDIPVVLAHHPVRDKTDTDVLSD